MLSYQLTKKPLPGLTSIEQLELLALADTFASTKLDLEESPGSIERGVKFAKKDGNLLSLRSPTGPKNVIIFFIRTVLPLEKVQTGEPVNGKRNLVPEIGTRWVKW